MLDRPGDELVCDAGRDMAGRWRDAAVNVLLQEGRPAEELVVALIGGGHADLVLVAEAVATGGRREVGVAPRAAQQG